MKILYFLDFHGHSMKKNVFMYGPEYGPWLQKFEKARIMPKLISSKTDMFRYQSCIFKVAAAKKTTARAFMLGLVPFCYTVESSVGCYRATASKETLAFGPGKWEEVGAIIGEALKESIERIEKFPNNNKKKRNQKMVELSHSKENILGYHHRFLTKGEET
jgi:hypothetical protein